MSNLVEIIETVYLLEIEVANSSNVSFLDIETSSINKIEISSGYSSVSALEIMGLDNYIGNFIDTYEIDCGSP